MQFKALIQGLCERLGLRYADDTLTDNEFVLQADNTQVRLQARGPLLQLITQLGAIPTSDSEKKSCTNVYWRDLARGPCASGLRLRWIRIQTIFFYTNVFKCMRFRYLSLSRPWKTFSWV